MTAAASSDKFQQYLKQFDAELSKVPVLLALEQKTGLPKTYLVGGVGAFAAVLVFLNIWGQLLVNLLGFTYPAYASFKAIESPSKLDDTQWLTYWVVFGFLSTLEFFSDFLLRWIPFYYVFKAGAILYMILPQFQGAQFLYLKFFRPYLVSEERIIDGHFARAAGKVSGAATAAATDFAQSQFKKD
ncbi:hypothetical protein HDU88_000780 [Geranomyces variabilis]|nr:hypothetical protein HDU88_000780 [Geranomyces variabilis]